MAYRPLQAQRFGPPLRACAWAYAYCGAALLFVAFVFYGYVAPPGSFARVWVVDSAADRSIPATWFAMMVLSSGLAAVLQAHMRGVVLHPDGIEMMEVIAFAWPKIRRFDWPVIDRFRFDTQQSVGLDLWDGSHEFLPEVGDPQALVRALGYVALARAIPFTGDPGVDPEEEMLGGQASPGGLARRGREGAGRGGGLAPPGPPLARSCAAGWQGGFVDHACPSLQQSRLPERVRRTEAATTSASLATPYELARSRTICGDRVC